MLAGGCQENTLDSFVLLLKNPSLSAINALFFLSAVGLNIFGLMVTSRLGSVFRAVLLTARTASVSCCVRSRDQGRKAPLICHTEMLLVDDRCGRSTSFSSTFMSGAAQWESSG